MKRGSTLRGGGGGGGGGKEGMCYYYIHLHMESLPGKMYLILQCKNLLIFFISGPDVSQATSSPEVSVLLSLHVSYSPHQSPPQIVGE